MTLTRRQVIAGAAAASGLVMTGCSTGRRGPQQTDALEFAPRRRALVAAFDVDATDRRAVRDALAKLAERTPDEVEVIVGVGASLFAKAGLADRQPRQLVEMPSFDGDLLDPARSHGDLLIQVGARTSGAAGAALDALARGLRRRWSVAGFRDGTSVSRGRPLATNLFGFSEGHGNPAPDRISDVVRVAANHGEPQWAVGGTYQVVRTIQFATAQWDKDSVAEQERIIGRRRDGHWLNGAAPHEPPPFAADPDGTTTALGAHARLAREPDGGAPPLLRRGYSYRAGGEEGLLFLAYQRDMERGFVGVQKRLAGERLARYVLTVGGGYFFVPPLDRDGAWWGATLFDR